MIATRLPLPHTMHLRKGKYYVSVNAPQEIEHLYPDKRCRRSTGTSDKRLANERAAAIVLEIMTDFERKAGTLDRFIETCRPYLEALGINVTEWHTKGYVTVTDHGEGWTSLIGDTHIDLGNGTPPIDMTQPATFELAEYWEVASWLTRNGYAVPAKALEFLTEDERAHLVGLTEPKKPSVSQLWKMSSKASSRGSFNLADKILNNFDNIPVQAPVKIDENPRKEKKFSDLIEPYLESRKRERHKEISSRRTACKYFVELAGDLPLHEYKAIHAYDVAQGLQERGLANATISKNITYANGLFRFAMQRRDEFGNELLDRLPWRDLQLSKYGTPALSYLPLSHDELMALFALEMPRQDRIVLSILIATGMRLDEVALMTWERLATHNGVLCFSLINDLEDVKVKNKGSMRYIPVPDILKPIIGNGGVGRLFDYRLDRDGKAQAAASDALMPHVRKITDNPRKVVHSLRGNFKDLVRDLEVSKEINDFITGHAQGDVGGKYGQGPSMAKRMEVMNRIQHPWFSA